MPLTFSLIAVLSAEGWISPLPSAPPSTWASAEEQVVFRRRMAGIAWTFLGRRTDEAAPRPDRRRVVFTGRVGAPEWASPTRLLFNPDAGDLDQICALAGIDGDCGILGGTAVYDYFLRRGRVDRAEISIEPVRFGPGLPLFSSWSWSEGIDHLGLTLGTERALNDRGTILRIYERTAQRR